MTEIANSLQVFVNGGDDETRTRDLCRDSARFFGNCLKLRGTDGYLNRVLEPQVTNIGP
jgi:hypothetical protein